MSAILREQLPEKVFTLPPHKNDEVKHEPKPIAEEKVSLLPEIKVQGPAVEAKRSVPKAEIHLPAIPQKGLPKNAERRLFTVANPASSGKKSSAKVQPLHDPIVPSKVQLRLKGGKPIENVAYGGKRAPLITSKAGMFNGKETTNNHRPPLVNNFMKGRKS